MKWISSLGKNFSTFSDNVTWIWNKASLTQATISLATYSANTFFEMVDQVRALRQAVPVLFTKEHSKKIANSMVYITIQDVLFPVLAVHFINNGVQNFYRRQEDPESSWHVPYTAGLCVLTIVDYSVKAYTYRQAVQSLIRITVLDAAAPSAFNADRTNPPLHACSKECNLKRRITGVFREPIILLTNDALVYMTRQFPYGGETISEVVRIFFNGRYITRLATPELCERHKFQLMMQESVLGLGLGYWLTSKLMDYALEQTIGLPPYIFHRTLKHVLLLFHANMATHMVLPLVEAKDATLPYDPFNIYEAVCRFIADVVFTGLKIRIGMDFKPEEGKPPIVTLSFVLQTLTTMLNQDFTTKKSFLPVFMQKSYQKARPYLLPTILQSTDNFVNDPLVGVYWEVIQDGTAEFVDRITAICKDKKTQMLSQAPRDQVVLALYYFLGLPQGITKIILMLSRDEDFWEFVEALNSWLQRHPVKGRLQLAATGTVEKLLQQDRPHETVVEKIEDSSSHIAAQELLPMPAVRQLIDVEVSKDEVKKEETTSDSLALNPHSLFGQDVRKRPTSEVVFTVNDLNSGFF
ncbi:MAG: hypothetical protein WC627_00580 [Legionella sp.]|jgi:hypothetical protein